MVDSLHDTPLPEADVRQDKPVLTVRSDTAKKSQPLIKICSFELTNDGSLNWSDLDVASHLMRRAVDHVPQNRAAWIAFIHPEDQAGYKNKLRSLTWDGAKASAKFRLKTSDRWPLGLA